MLFKSCQFIIFLSVATFAFGQESYTLNFTRFSIEDGLPNSSMRILGQDSTGYIWLTDPLTRFDGVNFKTFYEDIDDETSELISAYNMTDDGMGNIFFTSSLGIYKYDHNSQYVIRMPSVAFNDVNRKVVKTTNQEFWDLCRFHALKISMPSLDTASIKLYSYDDVYYGYYKNNYDKIWTYGKKVGIKSLDLITKEVCDYYIEELEKIKTSFYLDHDNKFWIFDDKQLFLLEEDTGQFKKIFDFSSLANFPMNTFQILFLKGKNCWWVVSNVNHLIFRLDLNSFKVESIELPQNLIIINKKTDVNEAIELPNGELVLGTSNAGLLFIDIFNQKIKQFNSPEDNGQTIINNYMVVELLVNGNTLFLCGVGQGLIKLELNKQYFKKYQPPAGQYYTDYSSNVRSLQSWGDQLIVGSISAASLYDLNTNSFQELLKPNKPPNAHKNTGFSAVVADSYGNLLIMYWAYVETCYIYYWDYKHDRIVDLTNYFSQTSFSASRCLFNDSENNFWISAQSGVICLSADMLYKNEFKGHENQYKWYSFKKWQKSGSEHDLHAINCIDQDDQQQIWVGSNKGLFVINPKNGMIKCFRNEKGKLSSLSSDDVRSIEITENNQIWIGTNGGGLNRYQPENESFRRFSLKEGLPDNVIYTIAEDLNGDLWMGTNKGLCKFNPINKHSQLFTPNDGIQNFEFNTNAVCKMPDGYLAFGGIDGFNVFHPDSISAKVSHRKLVLTSFKINQKEVPFSQEKMQLKYNENFLTMEFNLLDYFKTDKIQYAYKLEGLDSSWVNCGKINYANYSGLNPGKYIFRVKAANAHGIWSPYEISKIIVISPPWWKTWWFFLLASTTMFLTVYKLFLNKLQEKIIIDKLRMRISKDLHDEIGSTLSSIALYGTVAQKKFEKKDPMYNLLSKINDSTTQVMESINDIVWAINVDNDKLVNVIQRMRTYLSSLSDASEIKIISDFQEQVFEISLNMVERRNLYLIFKECVNNAIKYSQALELKISLYEKDGWIHLNVVDNGIGFNQQLEEEKLSLGGNGLKNIKNRSEELSGKLDIISTMNAGTNIYFKYKIKK